MKVRWREHGFILVTLLALITIVNYLIDYNGFLTGHHQEEYTAPYIKAHVPFDYLQNMLWPKIGVVVLLYIFYLWINRLIIPHINANKSKLWVYMFALLQLLLISYLLALGINLATYYAHPWYFNYGGFSFFTSFGYNDKPLQNLFTGFQNGLILAAVYAVYLAAREYIIYRVENSGPRKPYLLLIINQISFFLLIYILAVFNLMGRGQYLIYIFFITPALVVYFINMYWLFPSNGKAALSIRLIVRLVITTFSCTFLLFLLLFTRSGFSLNAWLICWGFQLLITTPLTWLLYQQQKDKILRLRNAEKDMLQSRADLQFLRSQINPHFLFNALNTLYGTALLEGSKNTAEGIQKLGDMMRFMLHENTLDFIPMEKEIAYLKNYIALQKLRIQTSPDIVIEDNITTEHCAHQIVPMLLIPFVENAFKHSISLDEKSWIKIKLVCDNDGISFEVRNSLPQLAVNDPEKEQSGIGIINVQERLQILYPNRHQLTYGVEADEFAVRLNLQPIITQ